jgi:N-acetylmuramoyl-L-alanine amidase
MDKRKNNGYVEDYETEGTGGNRAEHRYRLNKRKFAGSLFVLLLIAAVGVMTFFLLKGMLAEPGKQALAQDTDNLPEAKESRVKSVEAGRAGVKKGGTRMVVLDPGHGGFDIGATGSSGVFEDDLNLKVANRLKDDLEEEGIDVLMTRPDENALADTKDGDMAKRRQIITDSGSDIVVSIHMNWFEDAATNGPIVLYMPGSEQGQKLASSVQESINSNLKPKTSCKSRTDGTLYILKSGNQPCILVECGFISNPDEEASLKSKGYQEDLAESISRGILDYFGITEKKVSIK